MSQETGNWDMVTDGGSPETRPVEVVEEENNPQLTPDVEALATFSQQEGPLSFTILPVITDGQTDWRINVYMRGTQGPVYQSRRELTDEAAAQFGIASELQNRINQSLQYAQDNLEVPAALGDQRRVKRTLQELELMME